MKAELLESPSVEAPLLTDLGQTACIAQENDFDRTLATASGLARVRTITDRELALAAYAQAVALRDSCVERATANEARP